MYDFAAKKFTETLYLLDAAEAVAAERAVPRAITATEHKSNGNPQFSPDSTQLAFLSNRNGGP